MSWYLLALISVTAISVGTLFQRIAMKKEESDPVAASVIFQFLLGFITLGYALFVGFKFPDITLSPFFLLSGIFYAVGTMAFFYAYKHIEASQAAVYNGAGVIVTVAASMMFLKDKLTAMQLFGIMLILAAVTLVSYKTHKLKLNAGVWYVILGASAYGLAVVSDSYIIRRYDAVSYLPLICFLPGLLIFIRYLYKAPVILHAVKHIDRDLLIYTVLYAVQAITFYMALQMGALVAQMSSISKASIILTVILATVLLKEREDILRKILAAILTTAGVLFVTS